MSRSASTFPPTRVQSFNPLDLLPMDGAKVALARWQRRGGIEAGVAGSRRKFIRAAGAAFGVDRVGASLPAAELDRHFGLAVGNLVATVRAVLSQEKQT